MKKLLLLLVVGLLLTACGDKKKSDADDKKSDKSEVQIKEETAAAVKTQSAISLSGQDAPEEEVAAQPEPTTTTNGKADGNHASTATGTRQSRWTANQQEILNLFEGFIAALNAAQTMDDLVNVFRTFNTRADRLDAKTTAAEQAELTASDEYKTLMSRLQTVSERAGYRCAQNAIENGEDPTPYLQELQKYM